MLICEVGVLYTLRDDCVRVRWRFELSSSSRLSVLEDLLLEPQPKKRNMLESLAVVGVYKGISRFRDQKMGITHNRSKKEEQDVRQRNGQGGKDQWEREATRL